MTKAGLLLRAIISDSEAVNQQTAVESPIARILQKISKLDLSNREHFETYLRHKWTTKHIHGGHVLVTVLQGEMTLTDKAGEKIVRAGESWTEGPGDQHSVVNAGTTAARVVVNMLLPKGAEPTTIIKQ